MTTQTETMIEDRERSSGGFTLAEMLVAILLMLMTAAVLARGVSLAQSSYGTVTDTANAQMLLSTGITMLRHELGTAKDISLERDDNATYTVINYRTSSNGSQSSIMLEGVYQDIYLIQYANVITLEQTKNLLVNSKIATENLHLTYQSVSYDPVACMMTFTGLAVYREGQDNPLAEQGVLQIQTGSAAMIMGTETEAA